MIKVGITGGIGSGKSTVCKVFELLGIPVYYADDEAKKLLDDEKIKNKIVEVIGKKVLNNSKLIDRKKLASIIFDNREKLQKINNIVHPAVGNYFEEWAKKFQSEKYILKEAAILFESDAYKKVDKIIAVTAPLDIKIKRAITRDNISEEQVLLRIRNQMRDEEKISRSDFVIYNDEQHFIIPQIINIHKLLFSI